MRRAVLVLFFVLALTSPCLASELFDSQSESYGVSAVEEIGRASCRERV